MTLDRLEELRKQLLRAQRAENACIRKLSGVNAQATADKKAFGTLLARCHAARQRTLAAYDEWDRSVQMFHRGADRGSER